MSRKVVFTPEAIQHLDELESYIAGRSYHMRAMRYARRIISFCHSLGLVPFRGRTHKERGPNVRSVGFERRVTIVFDITRDQVIILGIFYGGRRPSL